MLDSTATASTPSSALDAPGPLSVIALVDCHCPSRPAKALKPRRGNFSLLRLVVLDHLSQKRQHGLRMGQAHSDPGDDLVVGRPFGRLLGGLEPKVHDEVE